MNKNSLINYEDIVLNDQISETPNAITYQCTILPNSDKCTAKIMKNEKQEMDRKFIEYIDMVKNINHYGIIPFVGYCPANKNVMQQNIIITKYAAFHSLQTILDKRSRGDDMQWWNPVNQFIVIYGIAHSMKYLHDSNIVHEKLTPSNILIDENIHPQITDFKLSKLYPFDFSIQNLIENKYFYYVDPYTLNNGGKITAKSDVYSFAIITIQILTGNSHIYEKEDDLEDLIEEIKNGLMPMIPNNFPSNLKQLLVSCLNIDPNLRPNFPQICMKLDSIINSLPEISTDIFREYKEKITGTNKDDIMSPEIIKMKEAADKGDPEMMYFYAKQRLDGSKNCKANKTEAIHYFTMAEKYGNIAAAEQLSILRNNGISIARSSSIDSLNPDQPKRKNESIKDENDYKNAEANIISLADDKTYDMPELNIDDILTNIDAEIKSKDKFSFDKSFVKELNFIFTDDAIERLTKLYNYIKVGIPVLLEGPTGTSKTLSSEIVCKLLNYELIRFNLSSETKTQDLIGRYVGDENSWAGITQQDGPFSYAFEKGKVLLLDEINLASASVLQCIEESLDSGVLSIEIPGRPLKNIKMHPNFRVIATQNPNKGSYAHKRQNLGLKFYSRFQIINFPAFTQSELLNIGQGLADKFGYNKPQVVTALVKFHKEWSENPLIADDSQCFTIREIAATVKALSQNDSIYDTIMTIYGARYQKELKNKLKETLQKYPILINDSQKFEIPNFPGCYVNDSLISTVKSAIFSLNNGRNIIITGKEGCGKTQVALWISEFYNSKFQKINSKEQSFFCVCTEEIKVADLVGHQAPSGKSDGTSELIKWQDGFLTKAIKLGFCSVLECIDEAPSTVTERLNGLLDQKYDTEQKFFDIPENSANPRVPIKDTFRILATANIDKISQMSPAFLNRFDIIVLENQIEPKFSQSQYYDLLKIILNKYCSDLAIKLKAPVPEEEIESESEEFIEDPDFAFSGSDDDEVVSTENSKNNQGTQNEEQFADISFSYSEKIIPMIYQKISNEKNISRISKICSAIIKLLSVFQNNNKISEADIVNFGFQLLQNNKQFDVPKEIEKELLSTFVPIKDKIDDPFFYQDSPTLCSFLAKLAAYSIIEQPVCVTGPTGAGKTSAARAFAQMRPHKSSFKSDFQMHSFHSGTKVSHFFGSTTLLDGKIVFHDGTLTKSLKFGLVFIADEFNLSTQSVMKSLALALDPTIGKNVFIPGIGQIINISPEFHFIACQNELGTLGRNAIPDSISQRFVYIDYPKPKKEDIQKICIKIAQENLPHDKKMNENEKDLARCIANYMINLNDRKLVYIPQWSLRDITKIFKRIYHQKSFKKLINITPLHHVLFYTMSVVSPNDVENVINDVRLILKNSFNLNDREVNEYIKCFKATPIIKNQSIGLCLMKEKSGILVNSIKDMVDNKLPSLWNAIFQTYLADENEPILFMGNSGFKTFLASYFLPKAQIITLNQETNVAQLLGSSCFMTNTEAKFFYIDYICKITQNDGLTYKLQEKYKNGDLNKEDILTIIKDAKKNTIPSSFFYALDHLADKLFDEHDNNQECVLSNTTLEFRPGLFLNSILRGQSLILKDLSNLPTIVLERFNELFSGRHNITLSEDIHNTFTDADHKELTNFNNSFRVFGTCPANSPTRLSEAVLSRFTVISLQEYTPEEQEIVLKSYIKNNDLCFKISDIDKLNQFALSYLTKHHIHFTFPQIIKVIEITSKINKETSTEIQKLNIGIAIYRVLGGLLESDQKKIDLFDQIKNFFDIHQIYRISKDTNNLIVSCPLTIKQREGIRGIESEFSNLFIKCTSAKECKKKIAFTRSFNDLLDVLHMVLAIHSPLILEGNPGQGKHTAIYYIANMLNIEVISIMISQSTKFEDLFGKVIITRQNEELRVEMVETQFIKIIKSTEDSGKRFLIILENINSASPALLNALVPVFDSHIQTILLPNGSTINKGKFDIIGIFNTQQMSSSKDKLPSSLINSSIYHVVPKPKKSEIVSIILIKFEYSKLSREEAIRFKDNFIQAQSLLSKEGTSSDVFSMNDIDKYILFRKLTKDFFDETTISQMIFAYKFSSDDIIQKILKELKLENMKFSPLFSYDIPPKNLFIRISDSESNGLLLPLINPPNDTSLVSKIDGLTLSQKHCLIFLACSLLSKRSCVIQGDTASGKSYLIRLFAELVGAKLNVFQMNSDSNISMLAGQSILNDELSESDISKLRKAFADLKMDEKIQQQIDDVIKIDFNNSKTYNPKSIKQLLQYIQSIESEIHDKSYFSDIEKAILVIKSVINPVNRFEHKESAFIHAIRNGEWVLIDGIESAPSLIAEKISSLCGDTPELNLFEYGSDFYFSKKNTSEKNKINDKFHLFITFNPNSMKESQMIDQTFLIKSLTFSLPPMDERIENSAQILLGSLINQKYSPELSKEIAVRYASMHQYAKSESQKNPEDFAGDIQFNGRTLKFGTKVFSYRNENTNSENNSSPNLAKLISFATKSLYWNSYINSQNNKDFHSNCLMKFKQKINDELLSNLQTGDMTPEIRNKKILLILRGIQRYVLGREKKYKYEFSYFLDLCNLIHISDLKYVQDHIEDTIKIIKSNLLPNEPKKNYFIPFGVLKALSSLFEIIVSPKSSIKREHTSLSLKDEELRNNKSLTVPLLKINLLNNLLKEQLFSEQSSILLENETYSNIINHISIFVSTSDRKLLVELLKEIKENNNLIDFIDESFPYLVFKDTKMMRIAYWLPLVKILINNNISFSYTIDNNLVNFNEDSSTDFCFDLIMNEKDNLSLSKDSCIRYSQRIKSMKVIEHNEKDEEKFLEKREKNDLTFYCIIKEMSKNSEQLYNKRLFLALFSKCSNMISNDSVENKSVNSIMSLRDLFVQSKRIPLIGFIWNLVYTLPEKVINDLSKIIHPIESKMLLSAERMFNNINFNKKVIEGIIEWSIWASRFEDSAPILYKSSLGSANVDDTIRAINEEINYLKKAPEQMKEFWNSEELIVKCENELIQLNKKKNNNDDYEKGLKILKRIKNLKRTLVDSKVPPKYYKMKVELVNKLDSITNCTEEKFKSAQKMVIQFLNEANSTVIDDKNGFIIWPQIDCTSKYIPTKNIKLFEALIWYSQIKMILKEINSGNDLMKNLWKLNDFDEMAYPREVLFTNLITNADDKNTGISLKDKNQAQSTLNAHMIFKLYEIDKSFITDPQRIYNIINSYMERNPCDENEVKWIYQTVTDLSSDFCIQIPKFYPVDLVFLIVNKKSHSDYRNGPLFKDNENNDFLKDMKSIMKQEFDSFRDAAKSIAKIAYRTIISANDVPPNEYERLRNAFNNQKRLSQSKYDIAEKIKIIFTFADALENRKDQKLLFDDVSFISSDWMKDDKLLNQFPSLIFWICKNQQVANKLEARYNKYKPKDDQIPLWLLTLRMMSSQSCIEFDTKEYGKVSKIICDESHDIINKYLKDSKEKNNKINYDWINILISNLQPQIINPYIKIIHDFFIMLSKDDYAHQSTEINQLKNNYIKDAVSTVINSILSSKYNDLITDSLSNSKSKNQFLAFPSKYIHKKINESIFDITESLSKDKKIKELKSFLGSLKRFENIIQDLQNAINDDQNNMKDFVEQQTKKENEERRNQKIHEIEQQINKYKRIFMSISFVNDRQSLNDYVQELIRLKDLLHPYSEIFENDGIDLDELNYSSSKDFFITILKNEDFETILFQKSYNMRKLYLFPTEKYDEKYNQAEKFRIKYVFKKHFQKIKLNLNLDSIIKVESVTKKIPVIYFGNGQISNIFIQSLKNLLHNLKSFDDQFFKILEYDQEIQKNLFTFLDNVKSQIASVSNNLKVEFENHYPCHKTNQIMQSYLKDFINNLRPLVNDVNNLTQDKLYNRWKIINENKQFMKLFTYPYDIQIPKIDIKIKKNDVPDFYSISDNNSLASPIICISPENKIACSVNKLKFSIGPIFPSQVHSPYCINIISFIKERTRYKIDKLSDPQYEKYITTKEIINSTEPVQLFVIPPPIQGDEPEILTLEGNLNIKSSSYQSFILPFELRLGILPLKVRIQCCEYKLAFENQRFRLCCDKIESGADINFKVINYYIQDRFILAVEIESLDENEADRPEVKINKSKQGFQIKLPDVEDPTRCQFVIKIAISQNLIATVICDFIIIPIIYAFEIYDFTSKRYESSSCQIIVVPGTKKLFCKITSLFKYKHKAQIEYDIPPLMKLKRVDKPINDKFCINDSCTFELNLDIPQNANNYLYKNYGIRVKIGNLEHNIQLKFINPSSYILYPESPEKYMTYNDDYLQKFPCFSYKYDKKKWINIQNNKELIRSIPDEKPFVIVSPFNFFTNIELFNTINYTINIKKIVSVSRYKNVTYFQLTNTENKSIIYNEQEKKAEKYTDIIRHYFMKDEIYTFYSIFGYINNDKNKWFPVFNIYPNIDNIELLEYDEKNGQKAIDNIIAMRNQISSTPLKSLRNYFSYSFDPPVEQTNFVIFMALLYSENTIHNIESILDQMPFEIKNQFYSIFYKIRPFINKKLSKEMHQIISHNLILKFAQIFIAKYHEIESHLFCLQFPLTLSDIESQQKIALDIFKSYDSKLTLTQSANTAFKFSEQVSAISKINLTPLPDEAQRKECFIISENAPPKACYIKDSFGKFDFEKYKNDKITDDSDNANSITRLPSIEMPKKLSIDGLNQFYSSCAQCAAVLPAYVRSNYLNNKDQNDSQEKFVKLLSIYTSLTKESTFNMTILSENINSFIESFKNCVKRLRKAGIFFSDKILPQSLRDIRYNNNQDFIHSPEIENPILNQVPWKTKNQISANYVKFSDPAFTKRKFKSLDTYSSTYDEKSSNFSDEEEENQEQELKDDLDDQEEDYENTDIDNKYILAQVAAVVDDDNHDDIDMNDDNESRSSQDKKPPLRAIDPKSIISKTYNHESVDDLFSKFTELDAIQRVLRRIKEMKKDGKLKFLNSTECKIDNQNELFKTNKTDFPVQIIINNSQYLIANLICKASNTNCPFLNMSCNLLIDCSSFITIENKLYLFMVLSSFSYALSALEIPFSIAIVADQKFRFVLKPFDENISFIVLQRVLDCLFIKRYRTNIADTFHHAINFLKSPYQSRTQRAIFLFSNGLDENLVLAHSWKDTILSNQNDSFGMIFVKSKLLDDQKYSAIQEMWDNFNKVVKSASSISRLIAINADVNPQTYDKIATVFADVLHRDTNQNCQFDQDKTDAKPQFTQKYNDLTKNIFDPIKHNIDYDMNELPKSIFRKNNQRFDVIGTKFQRLDVSHYKNKTEKIANSSPEKAIKEDFDQFIHKIVYSKRNSYRPLLETIFKPNKASQTILSSTGTDFDITALILNLINPVPDPLIYLEEKGGLVRNYGISIVIDSSKSCFNPISVNHSYQTIKTLFTALASIDIPCVDVIVATSSAPIVLCSEISSLRLFNEKSPFWPSLFNCLSENCEDNCDLEAAIHAAYDIRRMRAIDSTSLMFVFTDGLFQKEQKELIKSHTMTCLQSGINVFGIGIGIYPRGIVDIFPQAVYAINPNYLMHGIASCFGDVSNDSYDDSIKFLAPEICTINELRDSISKLIKNENKPIFKDLKKYLLQTQHTMDAFSDMYNEEQEARDATGELINPEGVNTEMYVKDILKGQKILIVMPYDCRANLKENPKVSPRFLSEPESAGDNTYVKKAVEFFGIDIVVVQNYKDAVKELTKQSKKGYCDYYATWVMSGLPYDIPLPDGGNQYLVLQFIDCLLQFWNNGGAVVMFSEGDPLTFQTNLFLEKIEFPNQIKTQLRVGGNHDGKRILRADKTGKLSKPATFNKHPLAFKSYQRASLAHNLVEIYEGETISYATNNKMQYYPFIPFMKDSENGISALFYPGRIVSSTQQIGDIIIDCGYTKLFDKMTEKGTFRYIQNIAGWTAQCELRRTKGIEPKDFRPIAVKFELDETQTIGLQKPPKNLGLLASSSGVSTSNLRRFFAIDHSGSVRNVGFYHNEVKSIFNNYYKNGDVIMIWESQASIISYSRMQQIWNNKEGDGGTDPSQIARELVSNSSIPHEHMILVTDGCVDSGSIQRSDQILKNSNVHFQYVTTYVIGKGGDLSVGAPFARGCGSKTIEVKPGSRREIVGANVIDFSILDSVDRIDNATQFNNSFTSLFNATKQKMIGTPGNSNLRSQFENLKKRLMKSGGLTAEVDRRISVLIGMASGSIKDVFDIDTIVAMQNK